MNLCLSYVKIYNSVSMPVKSVLAVVHSVIFVNWNKKLSKADRPAR